MKPNKILYENQEEVWKKARDFLVKLVSKFPCVKIVYVWASLAEEKFGLYEQEYRGLEGSDIDLVIVIDENFSLPSNWHWTHVSKSWFDLYTDIGFFEHEGHKHKIDGLFVFPSKHSLEKMNEALIGRSKKIYEKGVK